MSVMAETWLLGATGSSWTAGAVPTVLASAETALLAAVAEVRGKGARNEAVVVEMWAGVGGASEACSEAAAIKATFQVREPAEERAKGVA